MASDTPPQIDQSLVGYNDRKFLPVNLSPNGNYADSVIDAPLVDRAGNPRISAIDTTDGNDDAISVLLFTSDVPASVTVHAFKDNVSIVGDHAVAVADPMYQQASSAGLFGTTAPIGPITDANATAFALTAPTLEAPGSAGEQDIYTINGTILDVRGYGFTFIPMMVIGGSTLSARVQALCQCGVINGWAENARADAHVSSSIQSVILDATEYTEAIRDAGNLITITAAGPPADTSVFRVVGLWQGYAAA